MAARSAILCWLLITGLHLHKSRGQGATEVKKIQLEQLLAKVLDSIDAGLDFFDSHKDQLNLDSIIGSRLLEGQLFVLQQRLTYSSDEQQHPHPYSLVLNSEHVRQRIDTIQNKSRRISDAALPYIAESQPNYYHRIGPIVQSNFWTQEHLTRDVDVKLVSSPLYQGEAMHERDSDDCLTEFFGTGKRSQRCRISRRCWKLMTSPGYRYYSLTHQLFYLQVGESYGCFNGEFLTYTNSLAAGFCANILSEAQSIASQHYPEDRQDLFMEQQALCGIMGYHQFFRSDWLQHILMWQWKALGCWGSTLPVPSKSHDTTDRAGRPKREEKKLPDGCECHRTAVALGALAQYVRYLLEAMHENPVLDDISELEYTFRSGKTVLLTGQ